MDVFANILAELKKGRHSQKELAEFLGVTPQVFSDWKAGRNMSYMKHVEKISEFLEVSVDYLLGKNGAKKEPVQTDKLDFPVELFKQLSETQQRGIMDMIEAAWLRQQQQK